MIEVKEIKAVETTSIRSEILRPGQDLSNCIYPHDEDDTTFHLGGFVNDVQASIVSFYLEANPLFPEEIQYRFRGMATLEPYRNKGLASAILKHGFAILKSRNADLVWCNARTNALVLYQKLNMEICSEEFDIPTIGPHLLLKLKLK